MDSQLPVKDGQDDGSSNTGPQVIPDAHAVAQASSKPINPQDVSGDSPTGAVQQAVDSLPQEAQDTDLIEKDWVEKAKLIVAQLSEDPFEQQQELSKLKADYMKKRYNKDIKVSDTEEG